jgi:hypothetical protein
MQQNTIKYYFRQLKMQCHAQSKYSVNLCCIISKGLNNFKPAPVATVFVARRKQGSLSRNVQGENLKPLSFFSNSLFA